LGRRVGSHPAARRHWSWIRVTRAAIALLGQRPLGLADRGGTPRMTKVKQGGNDEEIARPSLGGAVTWRKHPRSPEERGRGKGNPNREPQLNGQLVGEVGET